MLFFVFSRAWDKEKTLSSHEELNKILRSDALPRSHRNSTVSKVYHEVHMTRLLSTAKISNVNRISEMVNFELDKDIEKDAFFAPHARDKTKKKTYFSISLPSSKFTISLILFKRECQHPSNKFEILLRHPRSSGDR